eukprot:Gb_24599 [translate_table: standard]
MALSTCKISGGPLETGIQNKAEPCRVNYNIVKVSHCMGSSLSPRLKYQYNEKGQCTVHALESIFKDSWGVYGMSNPYLCKDSKFLSSYHITRARNSEVQERIRDCEDVLSEPSTMHCDEATREASFPDEENGQFLTFLCSDDRPCIFLNPSSCRGLAKAAKYACNDAKFVNERARNDIVLLSRGITKLNDRARQDVAIIGSEFLKLDARAREDTGKIDIGVKRKAARLQRIAEGLTDKAQTKLKTAAAEHWSDGALEADLRRADLRARRRAMEDAFMALEFVKNIHDMMVRTMYQVPRNAESEGDKGLVEGLTIEKNGKALKIFPGKVSDDQITAMQDAYWSMASALSEADGIDYTDPDELELLIATLLDMDAIDGKSSASLLAECSSSPDVGTRQALANALADAPSMWTLGNAGMGALQRLAQDSNPVVSTAASKAIDELRRQWQIEEGDTLVFSMDESSDSETLISNLEIDDESEKA